MAAQINGLNNRVTTLTTVTTVKQTTSTMAKTMVMIDGEEEVEEAITVTEEENGLHRMATVVVTLHNMGAAEATAVSMDQILAITGRGGETMATRLVLHFSSTTTQLRTSICSNYLQPNREKQTSYKTMVAQVRLLGLLCHKINMPTKQGSLLKLQKSLLKRTSVQDGKGSKALIVTARLTLIVLILTVLAVVRLALVTQVVTLEAQAAHLVRVTMKLSQTRILL